MAGANSQIQISELDFDTIKNNLKTFLKSQDVLKDYNYEGSALSVLLDVLAYNTQYNAYYLNMVANEMFLDTALLRSSVVSHAKALNYTPRSARAPKAVINVLVNQVTSASITLPKNASFLSEAIDGRNYNFVTSDATTVSVVNNQGLFANVEIYQGNPSSITYTYNEQNNPQAVFKIPNENIDTSTLLVAVQQSSINTAYEIYTQPSDILKLDSTSKIYFLEEDVDGFYKIRFGDGILGKQLTDGNLVNLSYIVTDGTLAAGANSFLNIQSIDGFSNVVVTSVQAASTGLDKESIQSIKFQAPKTYTAQNRAVSKEDYITAIQQNSLGISFDAVSVWGGQENEPPVYGQVFVALKPAGGYNLTLIQKQRLIDDVLKPMSVMTVQPTIVDPDYTYLQLTANVYYDPKKTNLTSNQLKDQIKTALMTTSTQNLNTFNSTFNITDYNNSIAQVNQSIITNEIFVQVQKKIFPILTSPTTYKLYYGVPLKRGLFLSGINSSPSIKVRDPVTPSLIVDGLYFEEVPQATGGVESISLINPGFGYQSPPTVTILGDGTGATAEAQLSINGTIRDIVITNKGSNYTSAIVKITPSTNDTTGQLGSAVAQLEGRYGVLRTYYNDNLNVKKIFNSNAGTVDYNLGIVTLNSFSPFDVNNTLGQLTVSANPTTSIISSTYNRIITVDPYDPNSIIVNIIPKSS
jgi:hypothetical protein